MISDLFISIAQEEFVLHHIFLCSTSWAKMQLFFRTLVVAGLAGLLYRVSLVLNTTGYSFEHVVDSSSLWGSSTGDSSFHSNEEEKMNSVYTRYSNNDWTVRDTDSNDIGNDLHGVQKKKALERIAKLKLNLQTQQQQNKTMRLEERLHDLEAELTALGDRNNELEAILSDESTKARDKHNEETAGIASSQMKKNGETQNDSMGPAVSFYVYPLEDFPSFFGPNTTCDHKQIDVKHGIHHFALEAMMRHPWRTTDPLKADIAVIPSLIDLFSRQHCPGLQGSDVLREIEKAISKSPIFPKKRHLVIANDWKSRTFAEGDHAGNGREGRMPYVWVISF